MNGRKVKASNSSNAELNETTVNDYNQQAQPGPSNRGGNFVIKNSP